jgi:hypothetical protein
MSPATLREAFQLISAADRVLSNVSTAGKKLMEELTPVAGGDAANDDSRSADEPDTDQDPQAEDESAPEG